MAVKKKVLAELRAIAAVIAGPNWWTIHQTRLGEQYMVCMYCGASVTENHRTYAKECVHNSSVCLHERSKRVLSIP